MGGMRERSGREKKVGRNWRRESRSYLERNEKRKGRRGVERGAMRRK